MDKAELQSPAFQKLKELGIQYNQRAANVIKNCYDWYSNNDVDGFHKRTNLNGVNVEVAQLGFAKRLCADNANLCEIVEVNAGESEAKFEGVLELLRANKFSKMYRKQLEEMAATGTVGAYVRLEGAEIYDDGKVRGGDIKINYVSSNCIVPIRVENDEIIDCAFLGSGYLNGEQLTTLVVFRKTEGKYTAESYYFNADNELTDKATMLQLGEVKPFAIMRTAEVNNFDGMQGYGYPKLYTAIPFLKTIDLCYSVLFGDLDKGQKLLFINEIMASMQKDQNGNSYLTQEQKKLFILLGERLPEQKELIYEYNPEIRTAQIKEVFNLCLSLLSLSFGYGSKKYQLESGEIKTATEYVGQRQDSMQELNKQRVESIDYITDLVHALIWFHNTFSGESEWPTDEEILVEFDDSYVTDKATELDGWRNDALSFPDVLEFKIQYIMKRLNCEHEEAVKYLSTTTQDDNTDLED